MRRALSSGTDRRSVTLNRLLHGLDRQLGNRYLNAIQFLSIGRIVAKADASQLSRTVR